MTQTRPRGQNQARPEESKSFIPASPPRKLNTSGIQALLNEGHTSEGYKLPPDPKLEKLNSSKARSKRKAAERKLKTESALKKQRTDYALPNGTVENSSSTGNFYATNSHSSLTQADSRSETFSSKPTNTM